MPQLLTDAQCEELDKSNGSTRLIHPVTGAEYVLLTAREYEAVREEIEDQRERKAWGELGARMLAERLKDEPWGRP